MVAIKKPTVLWGRSVHDTRGSFTVRWDSDSLAAFLGKGVTFEQYNSIRTVGKTARGWHYNVTGEVGKLVTCPDGVAESFALDLVGDVGKVTSCMFNPKQQNKSFWVPPGHAHALLTYTSATVDYMSTHLYDATTERAMGIRCPEAVLTPNYESFRISEKDNREQTLESFLKVLKESSL
jgi:dTDP-4-dehydrorhamnose 3,5-epimerase-like enzyme